MSEIMQRRRSRTPKPSKSTESRSHLSTSCNECHKRKQKCDRKQPCNNCARRYPLPQCIYRKDAKSSNSAANISSRTSGMESQLLGYSTVSNEDADPWKDIPHLTLLLSENTESSGDIKQAAREINAFSEFLDSIEPVSAYQHLLTAMVSLPYLDDDEHYPPLAKDEADQTNQDIWDSGRDNAIAVQRLKWDAHYSETSGSLDRFSISSVDPLHFLPPTPNAQNVELFHVFFKLITKYVVSIDGNPSPNYYNDSWVPWAAKSPVLVQLGIYTAACYQSELQRVPPSQSPMALGLKAKSIRMLNEMLNSEQHSTTDETIAAVIYLITAEWYWGSRENVRAHIKGLLEMVRLRGGVEGEMNFFLRQMIILCDYHISCSDDLAPSFHHTIPDPVIVPIYMNTPFLKSKERFSNYSQQLNIDKETAAMLDDMRFLTLSILKFEDPKPPVQDLTKLITTSTWIRDRITALPNISTPDSLPRDFIYTSTRIAALIYCNAIVNRIPLSQACTVQDLNALWCNMWRVTLTQWKQIPGIFLWITLSANQTAQDKPHGRFLKSMIKSASFHIALAEWPVADGTFEAFAKLQSWLRKGQVKAKFE